MLNKMNFQERAFISPFRDIIKIVFIIISILYIIGCEKTPTEPNLTIADFKADQTKIALGEKVNFINLSEGKDLNFLWYFGDGTTSEEKDPSHKYISDGHYTVSLKATGTNGTDLVTKDDYINVTASDSSTIMADFTTDSTVIKVGKVVKFTNLSVGENLNFFWDFGDGATSREKDPSHQYLKEGYFTVSLKVTGTRGEDEEIKHNYIYVLPSTTNEPLIADFIAGPESGNTPLTVHFTNQSKGNYQSVLWEFGDGSTSTELHPTHVYTMPGNYSVKLTVNRTNDSDSKTRIDYIKVKNLEAKFYADNCLILAQEKVKFKDQSSGFIESWLWNFGDGTFSAEQSPQRQYTKVGKYTVSLTVTGPDGKSSTEMKSEYISVDEICEFTFSSIGPYFPKHIAGDGDFKLKCDFKVRATLELRNQDTQVWLKLYMHAKEPRCDWTEAEGTGEFSLVIIDPGLKIKEIMSQTSAEWLHEDRDCDYDYSDIDGNLEFELGRFKVRGDGPGCDLDGTTPDDTHVCLENVYFKARVGK